MKGLKWIWLPKAKYPDNQTARLNALSGQPVSGYTVCDIKRSYTFSERVVKAVIRFSGDTAVRLYINGEIIGTGPASVGGDFIGNERVRDNFYYYETEVFPNCEELEFFATVRLMPVQICEYSKGHGGFALSAELTLESGRTEEISTDPSWLIRKNCSYTAPRGYDGRIKPDSFVSAEVTEDIWSATLAPIPVREEHTVGKIGISLEAGEEKELILPFERIWGGFVYASADGAAELQIGCRELEEAPRWTLITLDGDEYRGFTLESAGELVIRVRTRSDTGAKINVGFIATHYPVAEEAETVTDDEALNTVLDTCKHALKICRQTHHLDSPKHCEPLACTGDYYIESLMTEFSFGDMRLAELDIIRTARLLERENGRMFHTTYSLIWVRMLYDTYMATGNISLLTKCRTALGLLLDRFSSYVGENGLVETPPDYMFIDWLFVDGISLHHPPKALGQSCLNMFYFGALDRAEFIYKELGDIEKAEECRGKREKLREAVNSQLYDSERGVYFEGLNTPTDEDQINKWLPMNTEKRYYRKHANILAAYVGICDDETAVRLVREVMDGETLEGEPQPYFLHYLFEAIFRCGLTEEHTLRLAELWKKPTLEFPKGIVEGFYAPEPTYHFDHSHAWGGSPLYSVPKALMGLQILEPSMKRIRLCPSLLGLGYASTELLTPYGKVTVEQKNGEMPIITKPEEIEIEL